LFGAQALGSVFFLHFSIERSSLRLLQFVEANSMLVSLALPFGFDI